MKGINNEYKLFNRNKRDKNWDKEKFLLSYNLYVFTQFSYFS